MILDRAVMLNYRKQLFLEALYLRIERLIDLLILAIIFIVTGIFYESLEIGDMDEEDLVLTNLPSEIETSSGKAHYYIIGGIVVLGLI